MKTSIPARFTHIRTLKEDACSKTFLASDHLLGHEKVIVKIMGKDHVGKIGDDLFEQFSWFIGVRHPQLSSILDGGITKQQHVFYVREYLPQSELFTSDPLKVVTPLILAVDFLRRHGRVHGAIKASNVFVFGNTVCLADPNLLGSSLPDIGEALHYSAPELLRGALPTLDSDLYALGALLYRVLTGRHLFEDPDPNRLRSKHLSASPQPAAFLSPVPQLLPGFILDLLGSEPSRRTSAFEKLKRTLQISSSDATRAPFVQQDALTVAFDLLQQPTTTLRAILIEGHTGIGKSRTLTQLQLYCGLRGKYFFTLDCASAENVLATIPRMLHCLITAGDVSSNDREMFDSMLQNFVPHLDVSRYPREKIISDFVGLLGFLSRRVPIVIALDNIDFADSAFESVLKQLAFRASETPLQLILTMTPPQTEFRWTATMASCLGTNYLRIRLWPLTRSESTHMIGFFERDNERQTKILQLSAGNPLFIEIYGKSTVDEHPPMIRKIAENQLSQLSSAARQVLEVLAAFQAPIRTNTLSLVSGTTSVSLDGELAALSELGIIERQADMVDITYPVLRAMVYDRIETDRKIKLHRDAFEILKTLEPQIQLLSYHAFAGKLAFDAAQLFRKLANQAFEVRDFVKAVAYYEQVKDCGVDESNILVSEDELRMAKSYRWTGKQKLWNEVLQKLLCRAAVQFDQELQAEVYSELAFAWDSSSLESRVTFIEKAIECSPTNSPKLIRRYNQLFFLAMRRGDLHRADEVLKKMACITQNDAGDAAFFNVAQGAFSYATEKFKEAIQSYLLCVPSDSQYSPIHRSVPLNNIGICFERLGDLDSAVHYLTRALEVEFEKGQGQILLLSNLASIKVKQGAMTLAEEFFTKALDKRKLLTSGGEEIDEGQFSRVLNIESLLFATYRGDYRNASEYLNQVRHSLGPGLHVDRTNLEIARCKFFIAIGLLEKGAALLRAFDTSRLGITKYFAVEHALLEAKLQQVSAQESAARLEHAYQLSKEIGTRYQECELCISLSSLYFELENRTGSIEYAERSFQLASDNGYGLLAPQALLVCGFVAENISEKLQFLSDAFQRASEMGLQELIAETAYHIGVAHLQQENVVTAREYLIRSTALTARLSEGVPAYARTKYLTKKWRQDALAALERCNETIPLSASMQFSTDTDKYFSGVYRFTTASSTAPSVKVLLACVEDLLLTSVNRAAVVVMNGSLPIKAKLTPELSQRIETFRGMAKNRIYFESLDTKGRTAAGWIPLTSETHQGGIYVMAQAHEPAFTEKEMELLTMVGNIASSALKRIESQQAARTEPQEISEFHGIIGASQKINEVYSHIQMAATNTATVLIEGESGTGKELVAKAIHAVGPRAKMPFIAVDCGAIPEALIEAELFGAKKGSYTGATADRVGMFEAANQGTILLDEISNTTPALQAKLLRVIQEREVRRIGETKGRAINVRLIVASNQSLETLVEAGQFRKDLLYRLKVLHIKLPPLRDRQDDIPMLAHAFLKRLNASNQTRKYFAQGVMEHLSKHPFPGNVRELQHSIERAYFLTSGFLITDVPLESSPIHNDAAAKDEIQSWFKDISEGRKDFWSAIHNRYKRRDISREKVLALVDFGLRSTGGSYKTMASMFRMKEDDYRRFMDFLRRNDCLLDFRPYRKAAASTSRES